jgi:UDP-2,3-diacylglucosamine pyrophosphatase LpxH
MIFPSRGGWAIHTVAYFVSDLHLGADPQLDDFDADQQFSEFIDKVSADEKDAALDLVLLGDTFDLWQIIDPADKTRESAEQIDLTLTPAAEAQRIGRAAAQHPKVFAALGRFLAAAPALRRLFCIYGNHDHSLIERSCQEAFVKAIPEAGQVSQQIVFSECYDNPALRVYAEHGNQYDRDNNSYENFYKLAECPGYFFVRLFWNRMEPLGAELNRLYPGKWTQVFRWMVQNRRWDLFSPALRIFRQYRTDRRVPSYVDIPGVPFLAEGAAQAPASLETYPELLFRESPPAAGAVFSANPAVEFTYRRLYVTDERFRNLIDLYFQETFSATPVVGPSASAEAAAPYALPFVRKDPYISAIERMFDNRENASPPYFRAHPLEANQYDYVLFGHTHEKLQKPIPDQVDKIYFNTGSWVTHLDLSGRAIHFNTYVRLAREDSGPVKVLWTDWT